MKPERWERIERLFALASELPADEQAAFLRREAGDDESIVVDVERMLAARSDGSRFIEPPESIGGPPPANLDIEWIGRRFDDFELTERIGQGGMGIVFRARQASLARDVAIKLLPHSPLMTPSATARFEKEARAAARMQHANIVSVFSVGAAPDAHWFAMEFVDGPDLSIEIRRLARVGDGPPARLPPFSSSDYVAAATRIVEQAASALAYAHSQGIVHRDVKPSNLLLDPECNVRIVDFGIARDEAQGTITSTSEQAGTPHYMSPEQVRHRLHGVDERTDIYSLGVVLYELLTLRRPFEGPTSADIWHRIVHDDAPRIRELAPRVPRDLEMVCSVAMSRELADRYSSATALRDDLRRFLAHEAVLASPPPIFRRMTRVLRRHRAVLSISIGSALAMVGGIAWSTNHTRRVQSDDCRRLLEEVIGLAEWDRDVDRVVEARKSLARVRRDGIAPNGGFLESAQQFEDRLRHDRDARVLEGTRLLASGKAQRRDERHYGRFRSAPSDHDLAEAMRVLSIGRTIHWDDDEIVRLSDVRNTFPTVSIRLAPDTLTARPDATVNASARLVDSVSSTLGDSEALGTLPIVGRAVPPGYWRFLVEIPGYGRAELTRYLIPSVDTYDLVARVLPDAEVEAGMHRIPAGHITFRKDSSLGCSYVGEGVDFASFWIDEEETSNAKYLAFLQTSGHAPPARWVALGFKGDWHSLPLGSAADRWLELPAAGLTLDEATACAEWYGKRLPTHIELERAIRGSAMVFTPEEGVDRPEAVGRSNVDGPDVRVHEDGVAGSYANYLRFALPVRAAGYQQAPEDLFHAYGNVAEVTESMLVEPQDGMLITFPWTRLNLGAAWDARSAKQTLASHAYEGVGDAYTRDYIGMRCARTARE